MGLQHEHTRGHKTLGAKWLYRPRFSHQRSLYLDSEVATNSPNDFYTANRCGSLKGRDIIKKRGLISKLHSSNQLTKYF